MSKLFTADEIERIVRRVCNRRIKIIVMDRDSRVGYLERFDYGIERIENTKQAIIVAIRKAEKE